jgi:hypothetical protein
VICPCCSDPDEKNAIGDLRSDSFP